MHKDSNEKTGKKKLEEGKKIYKNLVNSFALEKLLKSAPLIEEERKKFKEEEEEEERKILNP